MARRAAKVDKNQSEIVDALRKAGYSVVPLHAVGGGCPDLLIGKWNRTGLLEVKDETGKSSAKYRDSRCLTEDQRKFMHFWQGSVAIVWSVEEALIAAEMQCRPEKS